MMNLDAEVLELTEQEFDFMLLWIRSHVPEFLVLLTSDNLIDRSRDSIGDSDLGFVGGAQTELPAIVFSPVKRSPL